MAQPKNFGFGDDEKMLRDAAKKFFADNFPTDRLHKLVAENPDPNRTPKGHWDKSLWQKIVELGWTAVAVPESAGGVGMSMVAVAALAEEVGRAAFPSPFIPTVNSTLVLNSCSKSVEGNTVADQNLAHIVDGKAFSLVYLDQQGEFPSARSLKNNSSSNTTSNLTLDISFVADTLNGVGYFVQDPLKVDFFIVLAESGAETGLFVVAADAEGVSMELDAIVDLTRDQGRVSFNNVKVTDENVLCLTGGLTMLADAEPSMLVTIAADMCGAAEWQLQTTNEYAKMREQFGHPIGFFQAVKHPIVDMMVMIDQARSHVYNAACAIDCEPENAEKFARMAKSSAADTGVYCSSRSVQLHGGIGFTWECYLHLYFKRQMHNSVLMGDATYQRAKLAELMF